MISVLFLVTEYYKNIKTKAQTSFDTGKEWCKGNGVPARTCFVKMHAATEFTPRFDAARTSIRHLFKVNASPLKAKRSVYDPPDVLNPNLFPPDGALDVLQIVENGVDFTTNFGRSRRRDSLIPADYEPPRIGSSVNPDIVPGKGWSIQGTCPSGADMCDGEYDSWCKRGYDSSCLLYAHNDNRGEIRFDSLSGWGIFELSDMREGLIIIKYHDWMPVNANPETQGWSTVNNNPESTNERFLVEEPEHRDLKSKPGATASNNCRCGRCPSFFPLTSPCFSCQTQPNFATISNLSLPLTARSPRGTGTIGVNISRSRSAWSRSVPFWMTRNTLLKERARMWNLPCALPVAAAKRQWR